MKFLPDNINKDDIMLLDVKYVRGNKSNDYTDTLYIVYKEISTGTKKLYTINKPEIDIYFTKEEFRDYDYNKTFMELEKTEKIRCRYTSIPWTIAKTAGGEYEQALKQMMEKGDFRSKDKMNLYPYVFGSDLPIDAFYRVNWLLNYDNDAEKHPTKQFLDIEVDTISIPGFPKPGECPINAVSLVDEPTKTVYTFLLENEANPQIQEFKENINDIIQEAHEMFDESYGIFDYKIFMYREEDELEMIIDIFKLINTLKTDFLLVWNAGFDLPYFVARIEKLGGDPTEIICHKDFKNKVCYYKKDEKNFKVANKSDAFICTSYTKYVDQMILYAATRKGQKELRSNSLNYTGRDELGDEKIDYTEDANIKTLPYVNYKLFYLYNVKDTLLQYGIEKKVNDIDNLYLRTYSNCTGYDQIFKQTVMLKSRAYYEFLLQGLILGNNINVHIQHGDSTFSGALVGDPRLNDFCGVMLFGKRSMFIFNDAIDFDFSSMYPHIIISFNIERNTLVGKLIILDDEFNVDRYIHGFDGIDVDTNKWNSSDDDDDDEEKEADLKYDGGADFMDNYLTGDILSMGTKWFKLPTISEIDSKFKEEMNIRPYKRFSLKRIANKIIDNFSIKLGD